MEALYLRMKRVFENISLISSTIGAISYAIGRSSVGLRRSHCAVEDHAGSFKDCGFLLSFDSGGERDPSPQSSFRHRHERSTERNSSGFIPSVYGSSAKCRQYLFSLGYWLQRSEFLRRKVSRRFSLHGV